jgi:hypothetical protein
MKTFCILAFSALTLAASGAFAQEHGEGMPPMGAPEQMKSVDFLLGEWDVDVMVRMDPESEWMESKGTAKTVLELDGCVQTMHFEGEMMGMPFVGKDTMTYNRETQRFESFWIDSMSAHAAMSYGDWKGDSIVMSGSDQMMGESYQMRTTTTKVSAKEVAFVMEMSMDGENWYEGMKMTYHKKG